MKSLGLLLLPIHYSLKKVFFSTWGYSTVPRPKLKQGLNFTSCRTGPFSKEIIQLTQPASHFLPLIPRIQHSVPADSQVSYYLCLSGSHRGNFAIFLSDIWISLEELYQFWTSYTGFHSEQLHGNKHATHLNILNIVLLLLGLYFGVDFN